MSTPFIKFPGGKRNIIESLREYFPKKYNTYYEPFVGGGAVFFDIKPKKSVINDINKNIANSYKNIKSDVTKVITLLKKYSNEYKSLNEAKKVKYFYNQRDNFNRLIKKEDYGHRNTALLLFLNKTCFNGIYRENSKGEFNVPHGRYVNPKIIDEENLKETSKFLRTTKIESNDFEKIFKKGKKGDFFYIDPPYMPITQTAHFTMYDKSGFDKISQIRLRFAIEELDKKGCFILFNNSDHPFVRDLYTDNNKLFSSKSFKINTVKANRAVNSKASGRGKINELIITNY